MTSVINIRKAPSGWQTNPDYLYIGRWNGHRNLNKSKWHNPIKLVKDDIAAREFCIKQYTRYLLKNTVLIRSLDEIVGKTLVCWCAEKLCHSHVLATLAERDIWYGEATKSQKKLFEDNLPNIDDIGSMVSACVVSLRRANRLKNVYAEERLQSIKIVETTGSIYLKSRRSKNRQLIQKFRLQHEKAIARWVHFGGLVFGAKSKTNHIRGLINAELIQWKQLNLF